MKNENSDKNTTIALLGNPNCGKTTLFNLLTGARAKVGNWSGVTVEKKIGALKGDKKVQIVDLPGTYSLSGGSKDREIVGKYLKNTPPALVINIIDGLNIEKSLYLTGELSTLGIPYIIAINMADELKKNKVAFSPERLSALFGVPVIEISALKGMNSDLLIKTALSHHEVATPIKEFIDKDVGARFAYIDEQINSIIVRKRTKLQKVSEKIDKITTSKCLSILVLFFVITLIYFTSIKLGGLLGGLMAEFFDGIAKGCEVKLVAVNAPPWFISLFCVAILRGFASVVTFLPQILILFGLMSALEDSGYMARVAFIFDGIFYRLGLSGKSLIPLILSSGCTVTGLTATRVIESENERKLTLFLTPFVPCSAKIAVFAWLSSALFNGSALIAASLYFLSFAVCILSGVILKKLKIFSSEKGTFFLEIPLYRLPSIKNVVYSCVEKTKDFALKAGTTVFAVGILAWFLQNFGLTGYVGDSIEKSLLYTIGNGLKYVFYPLGFGNWQASVSVLSGILAKEAVIESLQIINADMSTLFNSPYSAYAFMAFVMLSPPCIASIAAAKRELGSKKLTILMIAFEFLTAYLTAFIINLIGVCILNENNLLLFSIVGIIILTIGVLAIKTLLINKCAGCGKCRKGENQCRKTKRFTT